MGKIGWTVIALMFAYALDAHPFGANSKTVFKRIADGVHSTRCSRCQIDALPFRNRHRCLFADGRLYFLSLKGKRQSNFGSYHDTALHGGYLSVYGLGENETNHGGNRVAHSRHFSWSHIHFGPIDKHENREDAFFVLKNTLFLLIYTRFENVTYRGLLMWQRGGAPGWQPVPIRVDERSQFLDGNTINGALAWTTEKNDNDSQDQGILYLTATDGWGRIKVSKLEVLFDEQSIDNRPISAAIRFVAEDDGSPVSFAGAIVALAHRLNKLYAFYGVQGCGFHWEKRSLIIIDLNSSLPSIDYVNLTSVYRSPPWAFNGPALVEQQGSHWFMFGGNIAAGEASTQFDARIWIFNLDTQRWKKVKRAMTPDNLNIFETCSAIDGDGGFVFLADFRNIYKAKLEKFYK